MRLVIVFLFMLFLVYALGLTLLFKVNRDMVMREEEVHAQIVSTLNNLEAEIVQLIGLVHDHILYDKPLLMAVNNSKMTSYERIVEIRTLQDILTFTQNRSTYISDIRCIIYTLDRSIGIVGKIDEIDYDHIEDMRRIQTVMGGTMISHNGELHIFTQYPGALVDPKSMLFSVDVLLDRSKINSNLIDLLPDGIQFELVFNQSGNEFVMVNNQLNFSEDAQGKYNTTIDTSADRLLTLTVLMPDDSSRLEVIIPVAMVVITLVVIFVAYIFSRWMTDIIDVTVEQESLARTARMQQLETQINPHFLYNSFHLLNSILHQGDIDTAIEYSALIGKYYRYITRSDGCETLLSHEIEHAGVYAQIQSRRYDGRIVVELPDAPSMKDVYVPRMIIQPILENAFEHGVDNMIDGGVVHLSYTFAQSNLCIVVEDSGNGLSDEQSAHLIGAMMEPNPNATGIINIGRRLMLKYGADYIPEFERSDLGGLKVTIRIPMNSASFPAQHN